MCKGLEARSSIDVPGSVKGLGMVRNGGQWREMRVQREVGWTSRGLGSSSVLGFIVWGMGPEGPGVVE